MNTLFDLILKTIVSFMLFTPFLYVSYRMQHSTWTASIIFLVGMITSMIITHKYVEHLKNS